MVWTRQPRIITRLDGSNPITRGIRFCAIGGIPVNLVNQYQGKLVGTAKAIAANFGRFGGGLAFNTVTGAANRVDFASAITGKIPDVTSYGSVFIQDGTSGAKQYLIFKDLGTNTNLFYIPVAAGGVSMLCGSGAGDITTTSYCAAPNVWHTASASSWPAGQTNPLSPVSGSIWCDGVKQSLTSSSNSMPAGGADGNAVSLNGRTSDNLRQLSGSQALSVIWDRILSDAEHQAFNANPWQIFQPQTARIYSFSAGGAVADNLAGVANSASNAVGSLPLGIPVAGTSASVASSSGTLALSELLSGAAFSEEMAVGSLLYMLFGDARAKADAAAAMVLSEYLAGAGTNISSANANLPLGITISGNAVDQNGVASGTLTLLELLVGAGIAESIGAGSASVVVPLNGVGLSIATAIGDLGFNIFGDASAQGSVVGDLSLSDMLSGTALGFATAGGSATVFGISSLSGEAVATADANGTISLSVPISGTALAEEISQAQLSLSKPVYGGAGGTAIATGQMALSAVLSGDALVNALASALLGVIVPSFAGSAHANSSALGDTSLGMPLLGAALSIGNANGGLGAQLIQLTGASAAVSIANALLTIIANLDGTALAEALAAGDTYITATDLLEGDALAEALAAADLSLILNFDANAFVVAGTGGQLSVATPVSSLVPIYIARIKERSYQMQVPFRDYTAQIFQ